MSSLPLIIQVIFWDMYVLLYYFIIFIYDKINYQTCSYRSHFEHCYFPLWPRVCVIKILHTFFFTSEAVVLPRNLWLHSILMFLTWHATAATLIHVYIVFHGT